MIDDTLSGRQLDEYQLEKMLGQGGMARVYRGIDVNLLRYVAIKVIDLPFRSETGYIERFKREAQAIARLDHPYIVSLYRYGEAKGVLYMAMQYIEGADLGAVMASFRETGDFIDPADVSQLIRNICSALDYAHQQGVIHRDIKPSNIMINKQDQAILTDFGLSLLTEHGTIGEIFGSPQYIAPEQAVSSAGAVPQSDLYSIGVILYELFTGQVPFDAEHPMDLAMMHMSEAVVPPRQLRPEISPLIEDVILKALAKQPNNRYQTGAELGKALEIAIETATRELAATKLNAPTTISTRVAEREEPLPDITELAQTKAARSTTPFALPPEPTKGALHQNHANFANHADILPLPSGIEQGAWVYVAAGAGVMIFVILLLIGLYLILA